MALKPYYEESGITIYHGDCREILPHLEPVDLVLTDPPYGTTGLEWDVVPDLPALWVMLHAACTGSFVMTASQPFTTDLINSNRKQFRYCWVWNKKIGGNVFLAVDQADDADSDVNTDTSGWTNRIEYIDTSASKITASGLWCIGAYSDSNAARTAQFDIFRGPL